MMKSKDCRKRARPAGLMHRFRHLVVETDWDNNLRRYEKGIDVFSWGVLVLSVLFFLPVTLSVLSR